MTSRFRWSLIEALKQPENLSKLFLFLAGAVVLLLAVTNLRRAWALPVASLGLVVLFYGAVYLKGYSMQELVEQRLAVRHSRSKPVARWAC